jgi:hypothetical protein
MPTAAASAFILSSMKASNAAYRSSAGLFAALPTSPARRTVGAISCGNCHCFAPAIRTAIPVTLPPGLARLATIPFSTGSPTPWKTIGRRLVAFYRSRRQRAVRYDHVNARDHQSFRLRLKSRRVSVSRTHIDDEVLAREVTAVPQAVTKCGTLCLPFLYRHPQG